MGTWRPDPASRRGDGRLDKVVGLLKIDGQVLTTLRAHDGEVAAQLVALVRALVRVPSPSGAEGDVADVLLAALQRLGYDEVRMDQAGNVIAVLRGSGSGPSLLLNGHMDHVPPLGMNDAYSGELLDGRQFGLHGPVIYGRGACDMKGGLGAMAIAGALIRASGVRLRGDFILTASVREELGGDGTRALLEGGLRPDFAVVCEPSNVQVVLGQRGTVNVGILVGGQSCHASMPELGHNALIEAAKLTVAVQTRLVGHLPIHPIFGPASLAVTNLVVNPGVVNVVPGECGITVNVRNHPGFLADEVLTAFRKLIAELAVDDPELVAHVFFLRSDQPPFSGFYIPPDARIAQEAARAVRTLTGVDPRFAVWRFGSDARLFSAAGIPTCGLGPGDPQVAHSNHECVAVDELVMAARAYALLGLQICA